MTIFLFIGLLFACSLWFWLTVVATPRFKNVEFVESVLHSPDIVVKIMHLDPEKESLDEKPFGKGYAVNEAYYLKLDRQRSLVKALQEILDLHSEDPEASAFGGPDVNFSCRVNKTFQLGIYVFSEQKCVSFEKQDGVPFLVFKLTSGEVEELESLSKKTKDDRTLYP